MKRLVIIIALWCLLGAGCDSESDSQKNTQFFPQSPVGATTTREVPEDYETIQEAIKAAESGDIIRIAAGTYVEDITIKSKRFSLRGAGKGLTVIQGMVYIQESADISFEGFTVQDGGIHARESSIIITGNQIMHNPGPGLWVEECPHALVSDNDILLNGREGILIDASSGVFGSNVVTQNTTDGIVVNNASVQIVFNEIHSNGRDGIAIRGIRYAASPNLLQNTIQNNGSVSNYDIICFGGNANPTGNGNVFSKCTNCAECRSFGAPATYYE